MKKREITAVAAMRADLARLWENGRNYFRRAGLLGRLSTTVAQGLVCSVIAYAAVSGIIPAFMLWAVNMGDVSAGQLVADITANAETLVSALVAVDTIGFGVAFIVLLLVISAAVLNPRGVQHEVPRESPIHTVTRGKPGGPSA